MAAGTSSRFVPLSAEIPKGLLEVNGEVLIERQIKQLKEAGIDDITIVLGYKAEKFQYLKEKFDVQLVFNEDFQRYNNTSSLIRVLDRLGETYICSSDNYFPNNVFLEKPQISYYSAQYAKGDTGEYCITTDEDDVIKKVSVGGADSWYMIGHVFFSKDFSSAFKEILIEEYKNEEVKHGYWEDVYIKHISELPPMMIKRYTPDDIKEFDTLDELRTFDKSYISDTRSKVVKEISSKLSCNESQLNSFKNQAHSGGYMLFSFCKEGENYIYNDQDKSIKKQ